MRPWGRRLAAAFAVALVLAGSGALAQPAKTPPVTTQTVAADIAATTDQIAALANAPSTVDAARKVFQLAADALAAGELDQAIALADFLHLMAEELAAAFDVIIVQRPDERSGVFRIYEDDPEARRYYLIVEAIDADGNVVPRFIVNEEDGRGGAFSTWAVRVPEEIYDSVRDDKLDDGVIQNDRLGIKHVGDLGIEWLMPTLGGMITAW